MSNVATLPNSVPETVNDRSYDMLRNSLASIPGVLSLVLLSNDGLPQAAYGVSTEEAQRITAACSGMASLSTALSADVDGRQVLHTVVSMQQRTIAITACGANSTLFVALEASAPVGLALGEIVRKARAYAEQMSTRPRPDLTAG
ncbi:putative regulator of Ras-like GTPase activity (Roadblock/LC7/MglB family) [Streptacidiphilus sp. BW17]|uniref:roadblock/LC7 domain-containing protein n=1 Tax=unclassified Streptacidiphilus TaxID=2643834 RepID=UPI003513DAA8